jgi:hypothetical protein
VLWAVGQHAIERSGIGLGKFFGFRIRIDPHQSPRRRFSWREADVGLL